MQTFYHLLVNTGLAAIVNFTVWFAITFFVFLETGSVFATGMIAGIYLTLTMLSGFWFGSLVDHHSKKGVIVTLLALAYRLLSDRYLSPSTPEAPAASPV